MAVNQDWKKRAKALGVLEQFSPEQLKLAEADPDYGWATTSNKAGYAAARTPEEKAMYHAQQQEANASKGFSGGTDGSLYSLMPTTMEANAARDAVKGYGDFTYSREPDYQGALNAVINREAFSYDPETDPVYSSYRKTYAREGRRAGEDALGQYAAMTGGRPSTAAMTAAQQAGNYYSAQMADKIPELYQQAYQRYLNEYAMRLQGLDALRQDYNREYGQYGDKYDRLTDYYGLAANEDAAARNRVDQAEQTAYQRRLSEDETAYERARQARLDAMSEAEWRAQFGDYSGLRALNIDVDKWLANQGQSTGRYYSGGGRTTQVESEAEPVRTPQGDTVNPTSPDYLQVLNRTLQTSYNPELKKTLLANDGVPADDLLYSKQLQIEDTNKGGYVHTAADTLEKEVSAITNQKQAIDWLTSKGLSSRDWQIPSEAAFNRGKNDPQSDYYGYTSYAQFLRDYAQYIYSEFGGKR